jgi:hypothetical protein
MHPFANLISSNPVSLPSINAAAAYALTGGSANQTHAQADIQQQQQQQQQQFLHQQQQAQQQQNSNNIYSNGLASQQYSRKILLFKQCIYTYTYSTNINGKHECHQ